MNDLEDLANNVEDSRKPTQGSIGKRLIAHLPMDTSADSHLASKLAKETETRLVSEGSGSTSRSLSTHYYESFLDPDILTRIKQSQSGSHAPSRQTQSPPSTSGILKASLPSWLLLFQGENFQRYRQITDDKIRRWKERRRDLGIRQNWRVCPCQASEEKYCSEYPANVLSNTSSPVWRGEFGVELRVMVPWAYDQSRQANCFVHTAGTVGTKYMYFFSDQHTVLPKHIAKRGTILGLPPGNPFHAGKEAVKDDRGWINIDPEDFPENNWAAPPFQEFFFWDEAQREMTSSTGGKPLLIISNKFTTESRLRPQNFISAPLLKLLLQYLTPRYSIIYKHHTSKKLEDDHGHEMNLNEKDMIRREFPEVVLYEDISAGAVDDDDVETSNLLLFGLHSLASAFISVRGGNCVVSSYFGGANVILYKFGNEGRSYDYFHHFANTTVHWTRGPSINPREKPFKKSITWGFNRNARKQYEVARQHRDQDFVKLILDNF